MNKRMFKKAEKLSVSRRRLTDNRELYPIGWLLKDARANGYFTNLDRIKEAILCMDEDHPNRQGLTTEDLANVKLLMEHPDVVDIAIVGVFQWFGTMGGKADIGKLLDEIRALKYEPELCLIVDEKLITEPESK